MRACLRWAWTDHEKRIHSEARHSRFCEAIAAKRKCKKQRGEIHAAQENANQIAWLSPGQFCECTKEKMMTNKTCDRCEHYMHQTIPARDESLLLAACADCAAAIRARGNQSPPIQPDGEPSRDSEIAAVKAEYKSAIRTVQRTRDRLRVLGAPLPGQTS